MKLCKKCFLCHPTLFLFVPEISFCGSNSMGSSEFIPHAHRCRALDEEVPLHLVIRVETVVLVNRFCPQPLSLCGILCLQEASGVTSLAVVGRLLGTISLGHCLGDPVPASPLSGKADSMDCPGCKQHLLALYLGGETSA